MRRNTPDVIQKRFNYASLYLTIMGRKSKLFFLDETGVQIFSRKRYGYSQVGSRANNTVGAIRSRNYSISAAISYTSLYFFEISNKPYNREEYTDFLAKFLTYLDQDGIKEAILVMDNVPFHRSIDVQEIVSRRGHNLVFLPPYSPFLNPIEEMFNQLKSLIIEAKSTTEDELYANVEGASSKITAENCRKYYEHMESYMSKCMRKIPIDN